MADVSLDDLIKKDKQKKGQVDKLRHVHHSSFRNSKRKNLPVAHVPSTIIKGAIEGPETLNLKSADLLKSVLTIIVMNVETTESKEISEIENPKDPELLQHKKKKKEKNNLEL